MTSAVAVAFLLAACSAEADTSQSQRAKADTSQSQGAIDGESRDYFEQSRLSCAATDAIFWTTDPSEPPPGVSIADALSRTPGAVLQDEDESRAVATVTKDGRVVRSLVLARWSKGNDSWFVESGATCKR